MSGRVARPTETDILADAVKRIRILEAVVPEIGGGGTVFCIGCYEVPAEFAECIDLTPGTYEDLGPLNETASNPSVAPVTDSEMPVGHYQCNYFAGFRVEVTLHLSITAGNSTQTRFWAGLSPDPGAPSTWTQLTNFADNPYEVTVTKLLDLDPTGIGDPTDIWNVWLGVNNPSILFGTIWSARFSFRWVNVNDPIPPPSPELVGQILVAVAGPDGAVWALLDPGTVGQVLTIGAGGEPEWA